MSSRLGDQSNGRSALIPLADPSGMQVSAAIPPLRVSGLVVCKADLVAALRLYVPQLADLEPLDGGRYLLRLADGE